MPNENIIKSTHKFECISREILKANAVTKIDYLSPQAVLLSTNMGKMSVKGENLFVDSLNKETGEIIIKGNVSVITYHEKDANNKWIKRIFG
ncbi:MAG: YabP/YqfC family sporulation protein [Clostridia bacterium]